DGVEVDGASTFKETVTFENGASGLDYAASSHDHNSTYYTETESDGRFVSKSSPTWDAKTSHAMVHGSLFVPDSDTETSPWPDYTSGINPGVAGSYIAPVQLPSGSVITNITLRGQDNNAANDIVLYLVEVISSTGVELVDTGSTSPSASIQSWSSTAGNVTIDNSSTHYVFRATFEEDVNLTLIDVIIEYTTTSP
ncbi:hypothetical protein KKC60_03185, partial [Patescibacteria group bacterium]|nr:hypothetical protein [Patescibacteria group bacterium]